jgi:hypothetical protein
MHNVKTITFKGKSEKIITNGSFTCLKVLSCTDKIVTPLVSFVYLDGEDDAEPIEVNFEYEILYTVGVYFETTPNHECSITYTMY